MKFEPKLYHLSNGVPVILDPMDIETTYVQIDFYTGAKDEQPNEYGITHFCEHMLNKGTQRFPTKKAILDFLDYNGGSTNASTSDRKVSLYGRIIAENLNVLLDLFADQIKNSLFDEKVLENERGVILDELNRVKNSNADKVYDFIEKTLFHKFIPNGMSVIGSPETISSFSREQLLDFVKNRFSATNCLITISGKISDADATIKYMENLFNFLPTNVVSQNNNLTYYPSIAHNNALKTDNTRLHIFFPALWPMDKEHIYQNISANFFEDYLLQELKQVLRYENGLVYGIGFGRYGNDNLRINAIHTEVLPDKMARVVELMAKTAYKTYSQNTIKDKDIEKIKSYSRLPNANFLENSNSRAGRLSSFYHKIGGMYDFYEDEKLNNSITVADVIKYTKGYFDGPMSIITQGADFDYDLKQIWIDNFK